MTEGIRACDSCGVDMDMRTYQTHECSAYLDDPYKNPFDHRLAGAKWMTPKGKVVAKGRSLTQADIDKLRPKSLLRRAIELFFRPIRG